jgi:hypothetical protein
MRSIRNICDAEDSRQRRLNACHSSRRLQIGWMATPTTDGLQAGHDTYWGN